MPHERIAKSKIVTWRRIVTTFLLFYVAMYFVWSRVSRVYFSRLDSEGYYFLTLNPVGLTGKCEIIVQTVFSPLIAIDRLAGGPTPSSLPLDL